MPDPGQDNQGQGKQDNPFVSRGGLKLRHALDTFGLDPAGWWAADLGCSTGGFTDCLLQAGAARVWSVDTAYGELAWKLRNDDRVRVMERTNALHADIPEEVAERGGVDLVVIDLGWTPQSRAIPAALRWLGRGGRVITLIKPHYEVEKSELGPKGVLDPERASAVVEEVLASMPGLGVRLLGSTRSPVRGGRKKGRGRGNLEWLAMLEKD